MNPRSMLELFQVEKIERLLDLKSEITTTSLLGWWLLE